MILAINTLGREVKMSRNFYGTLLLILAAIVLCSAIYIVEGLGVALIIFLIIVAIIIFVVACNILGMEWA